MQTTRRGEAVWEGDLMSGSGKVTAGTSGIFKDQAVSWPARTDQPGGKTSPEELIASAHAACFAMALSHGLAQGGNKPTRVQVSATVTFAKTDAGFRVTRSDLEVKGTVPGMDAQAFQAAAEKAKDGCPVSQALKNNVQMTVQASLA